MATELRPGMVFEKTMTVSEDHVARHLVGHGVGVLSTPELIRFIEICALEGVRAYLPPEQETVGTRVDIRHLAATPVGMKITARCALTGIDRRRLAFSFEVQDELDKVAEGTHDRFIVDRDRQQQRIQEKLAKWKRPA